jgi:hypothetical protein
MLLSDLYATVALCLQVQLDWLLQLQVDTGSVQRFSLTQLLAELA